MENEEMKKENTEEKGIFATIGGAIKKHAWDIVIGIGCFILGVVTLGLYTGTFTGSKDEVYTEVSPETDNM